MGPGFYKDAAPTVLDTRFAILYCGGKRSATPLSYARGASEHLGHPRALENAVAAALCRRSTNRRAARTGEAFFRPSGTCRGGRRMTQP